MSFSQTINWQQLTGPFGVTPLCFASNSNGDIFAGSYGWDIWRSTDDGLTSTQQNSGLGHYYIKSIRQIINNIIH